MPKKRAVRGRRGGLTKRSDTKEKKTETQKAFKDESEIGDNQTTPATERRSLRNLKSEQEESGNVVNEEKSNSVESAKIDDKADDGKNAEVDDGKNAEVDDGKNTEVKEANPTSPAVPTKSNETETSVVDESEIVAVETEEEERVVVNDNDNDGGFEDEVEEAFIDKDSDDDIQYIDEEVVEDKDQDLCVVLEGQLDDSSKNEKDNASELNKQSNDNNAVVDDNNFEEISEGSMDPIEQSEVIEAISDNEIVIDITEQDKEKDSNNEAAETLEQVFLATEKENFLVEDKDNDDISDTSLCGDDDKNNLSLEEISDEELDSSKKRHISRSDNTEQAVDNQKEDTKEEPTSITVEDSDVDDKKRHLDNEKDKSDIPSKKLKLDSESNNTNTNTDNKKSETPWDAAFYTNISSLPKAKEGGKPTLSHPSTFLQKNTISKEFSSCRFINISTQTQPLSKRGKIVQCNIRPISEEVSDESVRYKQIQSLTSSVSEKYRDQLPSSVSDIFQHVTSSELPEQGHYQFSMGPVTHADIDNQEFRDISLKCVQKFKLCFNSKHQGVFTAQLPKQEEVASLIRKLKRLELGTRYMIFSVTYGHGPGLSEDSFWTASIVYMYSQDNHLEKEKAVRDGKERARLCVESVPKTISKDFIQMLFPESLYISSRLGPTMDRSLMLGFSSYVMVEEATACYEMLLINGSKITMSAMDPVKEAPSPNLIDPGYIDEDGIVLIQDSAGNMTEDSKVLGSDPDNSTAKEIESTQSEKDGPEKENANVNDITKPEPDMKITTDNSIEGATENQKVQTDQNTSSEAGSILMVEEGATKSETSLEPESNLAALPSGEGQEIAGKNITCISETEDKGEKDLQEENTENKEEEDLQEKESVSHLSHTQEAAINEENSKDVAEHSKEDLPFEEKPDHSKGLGEEQAQEEETSQGKQNDETAIVELSTDIDNTSAPHQQDKTDDEKCDKASAEAKTDSKDTEAEDTGEKEHAGQREDVEEKQDAGEKVESPKLTEASETGERNKKMTGKEKCEKDTSLEDVSDDEMISSDLKPTENSKDDDVVILQEDPSKRIIAQIDLTQDTDEYSFTSNKNELEKAEKKKKEPNEKLSITDGNLQVTMEAIDVEGEEEPERILYPNQFHKFPSKDSYHKNKDTRYTGIHLQPGMRLVTRDGEIYVPSNAQEWTARYDIYKGENTKNYEQVSSIRSGSSLTDYVYDAPGSSRVQRPKSSIREKSLEHRDSYRREYRRSKSPSPRRDLGFERKTAPQPPRQSDHFQHSRPMYSKDYSHSHSYGYGNVSGKQGRGYSEWHSEHSEPKRGDVYQSSGDHSKMPYRHSRSPPYKSHKSWKDGGYHSNRKSPDHLPPAYEAKKGTTTTMGNFRSADRRTPDRYRRSQSRSLSPLSDMSLSSSSYSSRNRRTRTKRSKPSFVRRISRSPISISSRSQSLSPVSKSPSPQKYNRSHTHKSRRDQYSTMDRSKNTRVFRAKSRSRSRSPYWSKAKAKSRSPPYKSDERSPPYKRVALSPVTNRERAMEKHVTTGTKSSQSTWQNKSDKIRTTSYDALVPSSQAKGKSGDTKSTTFGNYQQQGPSPTYGFPMTSVNYSTPTAFPQWPTSAFPVATGYTSQQPQAYNNPSMAAQYNYSGMPGYTNMGNYAQYTTYGMPPTGTADPNQVAHPNYGTYTATTPQGSSQPMTATSMTGGPNKKTGQSSQQESASKKWSMGGSGGGALVFQRILSNVSRSKK